VYYRRCVPKEDVQSFGDASALQPVTAVARLLCLSLMSCNTPLRSNAWRNRAKEVVHVWQTNFEHTRAQILDDQLNQTPPGSEYVLSSPIESPEQGGRRRNTRLHPACTPSPSAFERRQSSDSSDAGSRVAAHRHKHKRNYSQVASSPP
jgi:hypothetical protein